MSDTEIANALLGREAKVKGDYGAPHNVIHAENFPCKRDKGSTQPITGRYTKDTSIITCPECIRIFQATPPTPPKKESTLTTNPGCFEWRKSDVDPLYLSPSVESTPITTQPWKESSMFSLAKSLCSFLAKASVLLFAFLWAADLYGRHEAKVTAVFAYGEECWGDAKDLYVSIRDDFKGVESEDTPRVSTETKRGTLIGVILGWYGAALIAVRRWGGFFQIVAQNIEGLSNRSIGNVLLTWLLSPAVAAVLGIFGVTYGSYIGTKAFAVKALKAEKKA